MPTPEARLRSIVDLLQQKVRARERHIQQLLDERAAVEEAIRWVLNTAAYPEQCRDDEAQEALGALEAKLSNLPADKATGRLYGH